MTPEDEVNAFINYLIGREVELRAGLPHMDKEGRIDELERVKRIFLYLFVENKVGQGR